MNKQLSTNALVIVVSLLGVCSVITPASAQLTTAITAVTKTEVAKTVDSVTTTTNTAEVGKGVTATLQETTNTTIGQLAGVATDSTTTAEVKDPSQAQLPSLDNPTALVQTTGQAAVGTNTTQQSTQADAKADLGLEIADFAKVGICLDASATLGIVNEGSSANCSKTVETLPNSVETPSVTVEILPNSVETPPVTVETSSVAIEIPSVSVKTQSVPEPTTLSGLALLGVYFISRRRQVVFPTKSIE
jgi:hypothetical protein